jgi:outer membrane biosynthesis protein TonB
MSRKERIVASIKLAIAAGAPVRRGLAERLLAGVLLAVAVAGAVLIPRLLVGTSPQHELGVGAPSMSGPPVVLAPGLPAQKSQAPAPSNPRIHATHVSVVPSASTHQPAAQPHPETSPAVQEPPPRTQPPSQPQTPAQPVTPPPTPHALAPSSLARKTTTCDGTFNGTGKDVVVPSGATCVLTRGAVITHDLSVSPGGTLNEQAVTVGHDLVAHSPAGISIDGGSVGHDLRIEGLNGSAGVQNRISNTTVGHDLVVTGNANAVALAGNSVGHALRVASATAPPQAAPKPPTPPHPHSVPKPKLPKPHHEPKLPEPPTPPKSHEHSKPQPEHPKPHSDEPKPHPDHPVQQQPPAPKPVHAAEPHGNGNGHKP